jgi:DNA-binding SARP family transcriptional activator/tetratricopeptide (TPR) repeat protein
VAGSSSFEVGLPHRVAAQDAHTSKGENVDFAVLGPVEVRVGGTALRLGGPRQRALLTALLLRANQVASVGYLVESVWEQPPAAPESNLRTYIAQLRKLLWDKKESASRLITRAGGYVLDVRPGEADVELFEDLTGPRSDTDAGTAATRLAQALALWRGPAADGTAVGARLAVELTRLADRRIDAALRYVRVAAELGRHGAVIDCLRPLVGEFPLHEELWAQLILAYHRADRQPEGLLAYHQVRQHLVDQLGIEPGPRLRELHRRLLAPAPAPRPAGPHRQLPMEIPEFTNRDAELRILDRLADPAGPARPARVVVIEGMAGVGKTRLAVQAAHRLVRQGWFADVQLWADLHGFDPRRPPVDPADVLDNFLRVLGVPGDQVPVDADARAALYRDRLAGRRALVVLDNAASPGQVRPLLPGDPSGLVLVTSRRSLGALEGATTVPLGVFTPAESVRMLAKIAGPERIAAEPAAAAEIAALCGQLPIAVCLVARRLRSRPAWSVAELARRLVAGGDGVDRFDADKSLRIAFDASYQALSAEEQRIFRLLSGHPGHTNTVESTAVLADVTVERAEDALERLLDEHLLQQVGPGRYGWHDLLRSYAAARARAEEPAPEAAYRRLLAWYVNSAVAASNAIDDNPKDTLADLDSAPALEFDGYDAALAWFEAERHTLGDAVRLAAELGLHAICWRLAAAPFLFFYLRSYWTDWMATHRIGLAAARQDGDLRGQALLLRNLGCGHGDLREFDLAVDCHKQAQDILVELGDRWGQAWNLNNLAVAYIELGLYAEAQDSLTVALPMFAETGDRHGEAICLGNLADVHRELRQSEPAIDLLHRALAIQTESGDRAGRRFTLNVLGGVHAETGSPDRAVECYRGCLDICTELGDRRGAARAHLALARVLDVSAGPRAAEPHWEAALAAFDDMGSPEADHIRETRSTTLPA